MPALEVSGVSKDFGRIIALRDVTFSVQPGEFVSILGRNGAGKTTLLNIISGVSRPSEGTVQLFGTNPSDRENKAKLAVISHEMFLYGNLTALENLEYYSRIYSVPDAQERIETVLKDVELTHRRFDLVATYSRGMTQRLTIARALLHEPSLLLLDEPFTGLDQHAIGMLITLLKRQKEMGRTILLTTHDLHTATALSDRYLVISKHKIVKDGLIVDTNPDKIRQAFFSSEVEEGVS
ncbi:MAG: heme ABC exporter ATP-binding protein CcmA [Candidatus Marinimicrobia bacterium]|nr:heme ABC exporter ATP-binding protein CcmA [Candidatus Neomarinimicrobiota bacterium]MBT3630363.1 heme ABC exporter ATP-binding protein CcmA [Candidatus Neomarinimicrobiota bacterium]MBT3823683.1 heme ABC exporter ATP-binding protein CcmA [Candidatus Neomarinimicrobiota bacterium]MBT4131969.1 heme ABC exporter ATP-binding protein CcmA [Candidatus Neomarinimicrobiota bacterium]MBT4294694.1 heme ABC exporter ATP-binding protein CcmA [Candidatus Neomarinimicrobiota bacterium]